MHMKPLNRTSAHAAVILILGCAAISMAQVHPNKTPQPAAGQEGGATPAVGPPPAPVGTPPPASGASSNQPADRDWKLANEPLLLLPEADQNLLQTAPPHLSIPHIKSLVEDLAQRDVAAAVPDSGRSNCTDKSEPWIIQTAVWDPDKDDKPVRVETYLYDPKKPPKVQKDLQRTRVYGSKKACFVLLAYVSAAAQNGAPAANMNSLLHSQGQLAAGDASTFMAIGGAPANGKDAAGPAVYVRKVQASIGQFYAAKAKTPAPLQDLIYLLTLSKFAQGLVPGKTSTTSAWIFGLNQVDNLPDPSDMWAQTGRPGSEFNPTAFTPYSAEVQFDNEGYYWYDFSVSFPVNKVDALEYNQGDSTVRTRQVDLKAVYATGNLFLHKADIKDPTTLWVPRLLFGIGIQGKPFDRMFVGAGFGFGFLHWAPLQAVQPFAGLGFNRVSQVQGTGASAVVEGRTIHKLVVGINVPVKSVVDRLKSSSGK